MAERQRHDGAKFGHGTREEFLLVAAPLRAGGGFARGVERGHHEDAVHDGGGAVAEVGGHVVEREEPEEVDGVVGGRVPFAEAVVEDRGEPAVEAGRGLRGVGAAGLAAVREGIVGEEAARDELGRVEAEDVVFGPEPHDVVARFVDPVAVGQECLAEAVGERGRERSAGVAPEAEEGEDGEVRAVPALLDGREHGREDAGDAGGLFAPECEEGGDGGLEAVVRGDEVGHARLAGGEVAGEGMAFGQDRRAEAADEGRAVHGGDDGERDAAGRGVFGLGEGGFRRVGREGDRHRVRRLGVGHEPAAAERGEVGDVERERSGRGHVGDKADGTGGVEDPVGAEARHGGGDGLDVRGIEACGEGGGGLAVEEG